MGNSRSGKKGRNSKASAFTYASSPLCDAFSRGWFGLPQLSKIAQNWEEVAKNRLNFDVKKCPSCGQQTMVKVGIIPAQTFQRSIIKKERAPPLSSLPRVDLDKIQF